MSADVKKDYRTVLQKMGEYAPYYICRYVQWYMTDPEDRETWEELCNCDINFKSKDGTLKTEKFCKENWLCREDSQKCIQVYMKHMKVVNTMRIYRKMVAKALEGDCNAAKWVEGFHSGEFFDETTDEMDEFLAKINIPNLKKGKR